MLSPDRVREIFSTPLDERKRRYSELASKVLNLAVLTTDELQEQTVLRDSLEQDADERRYGTILLGSQWMRRT
jgi:hypothetical protein